MSFGRVWYIGLKQYYITDELYRFLMEEKFWNDLEVRSLQYWEKGLTPGGKYDMRLVSL